MWGPKLKLPSSCLDLDCLISFAFSKQWVRREELIVVCVGTWQERGSMFLSENAVRVHVVNTPYDQNRD
jgi:hypothetical protein